eukprot:7183000-Prymnesium_polylepis.1
MPARPADLTLSNRVLALAPPPTLFDASSATGVPGQLDSSDGPCMTAVGARHGSTSDVSRRSHGKSLSTVAVTPMAQKLSSSPLQVPRYAHLFGHSTLSCSEITIPGPAFVYMLRTATSVLSSVQSHWAG